MPTGTDTMTLKDAAAAYAKALADVKFYREAVYDAIRKEHLQGQLSIRDIARETGFSYGRVGQILRGE